MHVFILQTKGEATLPSWYVFPEEVPACRCPAAGVIDLPVDILGDRASIRIRILRRLRSCVIRATG